MLEYYGDGLNTTDALKASLNKHRDCLDKLITRFFTRFRKDWTSAAHLVERFTMWENITHVNVSSNAALRVSLGSRPSIAAEILRNPTIRTMGLAWCRTPTSKNDGT